MNPPELTILAVAADAVCDPETGICAVPQPPVPSSEAEPAAGAVPGSEETPGA